MDLSYYKTKGNRLFLGWMFLVCLINYLACSLLPSNKQQEVSANSVIDKISVTNSTASYINGNIPPYTIGDAPIVTTSSVVEKGKTITVFVTVPDSATTLFISASEIKSSYLNIRFGTDTDQINGYYTLNLSSAQALQKASLLTSNKSVGSLKTYSIDISTKADFYMNSFDLDFAYGTAANISAISHFPISINAIYPYQNQVRIGFRPPDASNITDYSIQITCPNGQTLTYHEGQITGCDQCEISHDKTNNLEWINVVPADFGSYSVTFSADFVAKYQNEIMLLLMINAGGRIEDITPNIDISPNCMPGQICSGIFTVDFRLGPPTSVKIAISRPTPINFFLPSGVNTFIPDNEKYYPGAGIRINGDNNPANYLTANLQVMPATDGLTFILKRSRGPARVLAGNNITYYINDDNPNDIVVKPIDLPSGGASLPISIELPNVPGLSMSDDTTVFILEANSNTDGSTVAKDSIKVFPFSSLLVFFSGERNGPLNILRLLSSDFDSHQGIYLIANTMYNKGYDVRYYHPDEYRDKTKDILNELKIAIGIRLVENIALFGYSHGAECVYDLLSTTRGYVQSCFCPTNGFPVPNTTNIVQIISNNNTKIPLTVYVDGIQYYIDNPLYSDISNACLTSIPEISSYHANYYETNGTELACDALKALLLLNGIPIVGDFCNYKGCECIFPNSANGENNDLTTPIASHFSIHTDPNVINSIISLIEQFVPNF